MICARQNKKEAILRGIAARLNNDKVQEIETGVAEVKKICWLRLNNIITSAQQDSNGGAKL